MGNGVYARRRRSLPTGLDHVVDVGSSAGKQRLDGAVRSVADPAPQVPLFGFLGRPGAEPDALHPAFDDVAERNLKEIHWAWGDKTQEYVALVDFQSVDQDAYIDTGKEVLRNSSYYELMKKFDNTPLFMSWLISMGIRPPHDMSYPFPVIYLYKLRSKQESASP